MVFSSMFFLWIFLPIVLGLYYILPAKFHNMVLLLFSIIFYAWGEPKYVVLIIFSGIVNYIFGLYMGSRFSNKRTMLTLCVTVNLLLLGYFKYFNFFVHLINNVIHKQMISPREIALPLGISFYTFQALSYVIDAYKGQCSVQRNPAKLFLYIALFPQLVAGPIVRYKDVAAQIDHRESSADKIVYGIKRFLYGLAKKVLLANTFAEYADRVFEHGDISFSSAAIWTGILFYTLQIYYDFSGYSDMAIGLGKMFGFDFLENFQYPYISQSIQEFWRRWHISLSTWFREYVYIPLGGNRKGRVRTYLNLSIVFLLTGLWHGASLSFVAWGLYHGFFLVIERLFLGDLLKKNRFKILNHLYAIIVVVIGWVPFRVDGLKASVDYIIKMFSFSDGHYSVMDVFSTYSILLLLTGFLFTGILQNAVPRMKACFDDEKKLVRSEFVLLFSMFFLCIVKLVSNAYNPFIYFRF